MDITTQERKVCDVEIEIISFSRFFVLIEIVILWVYYTIPFGFSLFRHFWVLTVQHS